MQSVIEGRVYKFGDNINSDIIIPGRYLIYIDRERLGQHAFEMLGEGFADKLRSFDILVAGRNFGCGSAREQAATAIQGLGIKAVVAVRSRARSIATPSTTGFPSWSARISARRCAKAIESASTSKPAKSNWRTRKYPFPKMPESVRKILELGGLAEYLKTQLTL